MRLWMCCSGHGRQTRATKRGLSSTSSSLRQAPQSSRSALMLAGAQQGPLEAGPSGAASAAAAAAEHQQQVQQVQRTEGRPADAARQPHGQSPRADPRSVEAEAAAAPAAAAEGHHGEAAAAPPAAVPVERDVRSAPPTPIRSAEVSAAAMASGGAASGTAPDGGDAAHLVWLALNSADDDVGPETPLISTLGTNSSSARPSSGHAVKHQQEGLAAAPPPPVQQQHAARASSAGVIPLLAAANSARAPAEAPAARAVSSDGGTGGSTGTGAASAVSTRRAAQHEALLEARPGAALMMDSNLAGAASVPTSVYSLEAEARGSAPALPFTTDVEALRGVQLLAATAFLGAGVVRLRALGPAGEPLTIKLTEVPCGADGRPHTAVPTSGDFDDSAAWQRLGSCSEALQAANEVAVLGLVGQHPHIARMLRAQMGVSLRRCTRTPAAASGVSITGAAAAAPTLVPAPPSPTAATMQFPTRGAFLDGSPCDFMDDLPPRQHRRQQQQQPRFLFSTCSTQSRSAASLYDPASAPPPRAAPTLPAGQQGGLQAGGADPDGVGPAASPVCLALVLEGCELGDLQAGLEAGLLGRGDHVDWQAALRTLLEVALALRHLHALRLPASASSSSSSGNAGGGGGAAAAAAAPAPHGCCCVVHRGLQPSAVLLCAAPHAPRGFTAKLADFGLAALAMAPEPPLQQPPQQQPYGVGRAVASSAGGRGGGSSAAVGPAERLPPEAYRGVAPHPAVDAYMFGLLVHSVAHGGRRPFEGSPPASVPAMVIRGARPAFDAHVPRSVRALAESCWAAEPGERPSAAAIVDTLTRLLAEAEAAQPPRDVLPQVRPATVNDEE